MANLDTPYSKLFLALHFPASLGSDEDNFEPQCLTGLHRIDQVAYWPVLSLYEPRFESEFGKFNEYLENARRVNTAISVNVVLSNLQELLAAVSLQYGPA